MVLFLVSAVERNIYDQRSLEYHIYENHGEIRVIRRTLHQIRTGGFLSPNNKLIVSVLFICILLFYQMFMSSVQIIIEIYIAGNLYHCICNLCVTSIASKILQHLVTCV